MISRDEKRILRELALRVHDIACLPEQETKRELWRKHTALKGVRPLIFVSPEGSWAEILPDSALLCETPIARELERMLRERLFRFDCIKDDVPIENTVDIPVSGIPINAGWGLTPKVRRSSDARGSCHHVPVIETPSDWKKLRLPHLAVNEGAAQAKAEAWRDAVGDLLNIRVTGIKLFDFHLTHIYCDFRGLENFLYDLSDEPDMVEDMFSFFEEGMEGLLREAEAMHLIRANNDATYHYTGGLGYSRELPDEAKSFSDVWGAAEAQEYAVISPKMFYETILPHELRLLSHFGLNGYGCCDDLTDKLDGVLRIKNLRRVAACPWANLEKMADRLKKDYILTWKPNPAYLAAERFDEKGVLEYMTRSLEQAKAGYPEIILRDTHSCRNDPSRFTKFVTVTRKAIQTVYGD